MAWLRVDDTALMHPKCIRLRSLGHRPAEVIGFVMLCATWSAQHLTDCFVPAGIGPQVDDDWERLSAQAVVVGILTEATNELGEPGWLIVNGDGLFHLMSKAEVLLNRARRNGSRRIAAKIEVLLRDGDQCRYCGHTVTEHDHRGAYGRQLEHVDPEDPHSLIVVSCRACNQRKGRRTPEQASMRLLPPPGEPFWQPSTLAWLTKYDAHPRPGQPAPDTAPALPIQGEGTPAPQQPAGHRTPPVSEPPEATRPDPNPPTPAMPLGRDGMGRAGSGQAGQGRGVGSSPPAAAASAGTKRKTRRGSRARTPGGRGVRGNGTSGGAA